MARITIEDCIKKVPNKFALTIMAAHRVKQLREGSKPLVHSPENREIVVALREIAQGKVRPNKDLSKIDRVDRILEDEDAAE
ncbi:MAG TPA: DNA-directed RNA polymerase subunit omega [Proteobacteria bacterium]|mgnify:CR=1 FL=1|nr:DNA-directed RNA polymerase subunit omega [Pseudomonadota bacterium]